MLATKSKSVVTLFVRYLDVSNEALAAHQDSFPYKQILTVSGIILGDRKIGTIVYEEDPDMPIDYFTIAFSRNSRRLELVSEELEKDTAFRWKVRREYLERVVERPQEYIRHPERLDWEWLKSRLGIGATEAESGLMVRDVMTRGFWHISPEASLRAAAGLMKEANVGALPVYTGESLVGIITDRDITVRAVAEGLDPGKTSVQDVMTAGVTCCNEELDLKSAAKVMEQRQVRRLPILDQANRPAGILSVADVAIHAGDEHLTAELVTRICQPAGQVRL